MRRTTPTPTSLEHLACLAVQGGNFSFLLGDFLNGFYRHPTLEALEAEPIVLAGQLSGGAVLDAFLAATAHSLANLQSRLGPVWAFGDARYLRRPFFPIKAAAFRATLLLESSPPFRARNLFVTANALSRA